MNIVLSDVIWLFAISTLLAIWWQSMQVKERALKAVKKRCEELDLQFLDQNVALKTLSLKRGNAGRVQLSRIYAFEFSSTGDERYHGQIMLLGRQIQSIHIQPHRFN